MTGVLGERQKDLKHRGKGEGLVKMEAEFGFIVATSQRTPRDLEPSFQQKLEEVRTDSLPEPSEGAWPWGRLDFRFLASTAGRDKISVFPLEEVLATHSSVLAWRIPWTEEPYNP